MKQLTKNDLREMVRRELKAALNEEQEKIQDAITLLTDHGYTVTHDALPDAVAAPADPAPVPENPPTTA